MSNIPNSNTKGFSESLSGCVRNIGNNPCKAFITVGVGTSVIVQAVERINFSKNFQNEQNVHIQYSFYLKDHV